MADPDGPKKRPYLGRNMFLTASFEIFRGSVYKWLAVPAVVCINSGNVSVNVEDRELTTTHCP